VALDHAPTTADLASHSADEWLRIYRAPRTSRSPHRPLLTLLPRS